MALGHGFGGVMHECMIFKQRESAFGFGKLAYLMRPNTFGYNSMLIDLRLDVGETRGLQLCTLVRRERVLIALAL